MDSDAHGKPCILTGSLFPLIWICNCITDTAGQTLVDTAVMFIINRYRHLFLKFSERVKYLLN